MRVVAFAAGAAVLGDCTLLEVPLAGAAGVDVRQVVAAATAAVGGTSAWRWMRLLLFVVWVFALLVLMVFYPSCSVSGLQQGFNQSVAACALGLFEGWDYVHSPLLRACLCRLSYAVLVSWIRVQWSAPASAAAVTIGYFEGGDMERAVSATAARLVCLFVCVVSTWFWGRGACVHG